LITQNCNLACQYCFITKSKFTIDIPTAKKAVDFIFAHSSVNEKVDIGFFGGEPLLEFERLKDITCMIENHPEFLNRIIEIQVTTNGTIFSNEIADFLTEHNIGLGISYDGIPMVQDTSRRFKDGGPSAKIVERNLQKAIECFQNIMVNAVFTPSTYKYLPLSIEYLYALGIRRIFINPDFSGNWQTTDIASLQEVYNTIAMTYVHWHEINEPAFISLIDGKMMVIMNDGYNINERCQMGKKEFAIAPNGNIFPCERLVGDSRSNEHCIGNVDIGVDYRKFCSNKNFAKPAPSSCTSCTLKKYCMNWCGCSNYFSTGNYNMPGPFICASEKASISAAFLAFQQLESLYGASLIERMYGNNCKKELVRN
jgi:uncharacterized protein